jgi:hypothetical protein
MSKAEQGNGGRTLPGLGYSEAVGIHVCRVSSTLVLQAYRSGELAKEDQGTTSVDEDGSCRQGDTLPLGFGERVSKGAMKKTLGTQGGRRGGGKKEEAFGGKQEVK